MGKFGSGMPRRGEMVLASWEARFYDIRKDVFMRWSQQHGLGQGDNEYEKRVNTDLGTRIE